MDLKNTTLLLVFTKNPVLGKVKTRLAAAIGEDEALNVHKALMQHTINQLVHCTCDKVVYYAEGIESNDLFSKNGYRQEIQSGTDLGVRMKNAFTAEFSHGYQSIVIVGTDCPEIDAASIFLAFLQLETKDVVLGPAHDGGYYLLGLSAMYSALFEGIAWSTSSVFEQTVELAVKANLSIGDVSMKHDIDTLNDLKASDFGKVHFPHLMNQ